jgi:hypothetical protein
MSERALKTETEADRRKHDRYTVLWSATIISGDQQYNCVIVNISARGAMIRLSKTISCYPTITLACPRFGSLGAEVAWRRDKELGIRFIAEPAQVAELLCDLLP